MPHDCPNPEYMPNLPMPSQDNRSDIHRRFDEIAARCVAPLRAISDAGESVRPIVINQVMGLIVKELGQLHFNGLPE